MEQPGPKAVLTDIFGAALAAAQGKALIAARSRFEGDDWIYNAGPSPLRWSLPSGGRVLVVGAGKATASLAQGLEAVLGSRIDDGVIVTEEEPWRVVGDKLLGVNVPGTLAGDARSRRADGGGGERGLASAGM